MTTSRHSPLGARNESARDVPKANGRRRGRDEVAARTSRHCALLARHVRASILPLTGRLTVTSANAYRPTTSGVTYAHAQFARWVYDESGGWGPWACRRAA